MAEQDTPKSHNVHNVQPYTQDELSNRIAEQSVDQNRLAATTHTTMAALDEFRDTIAAMANWINAQAAQAQPQGPGAEDAGKKRGR